jgi:hypothetical protein
MQHSLRSESDALCWHGHGPGCGLVRGRRAPTAPHEDVWSDRVEPDESGVNPDTVASSRARLQSTGAWMAQHCVYSSSRSAGTSLRQRAWRG